MTNKTKQVIYWSLFDFANSSYAVIILAFVFAVYFTSTVCKNLPAADFYWSLGINISMIISAFLNPILGAIADKTSNKKIFLFIFTLLSVVFTGLMYFTGEGLILYSLTVFILSNIGFQSGLTFYDAFISDISDEKDYNKVSGIGYAVGYAGSFVSVLIAVILKDNVNLLFVITAMFYAFFSLPLFLFVKEKKKSYESTKINFNNIKTNFFFGFRKVVDTIIHINKYKNLRNYLISFFLYIDAVNTIIFFAGIYAKKTLNFSLTELAVFFIIVQITALIGSIIFGVRGDRIGIKKSINFTLFFWILIVFSIFFFVDENSFLNIGSFKIHYFFIIGGFSGIFLGSTQALSRTLMTILTPLEIKTEFFGFYSLFEKTSTLLGPLVFGLVSLYTGSQKFAILSVGIFFILGIIMLRTVKEKPYKTN